jgi:hypothetical protein
MALASTIGFLFGTHQFANGLVPYLYKCHNRSRIPDSLATFLRINGVGVILDT